MPWSEIEFLPSSLVTRDSVGLAPPAIHYSPCAVPPFDLNFQTQWDLIVLGNAPTLLQARGLAKYINHEKTTGVMLTSTRYDE
jgi:hypothetical protein